MYQSPDKEHIQAVREAAEAAGKVLDIFEERYPDDMRPREAIKAAFSWCNEMITTYEARQFAFAAHAAARRSRDPAAIAAARAAGHAAATAHVINHSAATRRYVEKALLLKKEARIPAASNHE